MRKNVTIYVPVGKIVHPSLGGGDTVGYASYSVAERAVAEQMNPDYWYPNGVRIEGRNFELPDDAFWTNDLVSVELYSGGIEGDSVHSGGAWQPPVYGLVHVWQVCLSRIRVNGYLFEPGTDCHIQSMELHAGVSRFPYRNAKLVRANDIEEF